MRKLIATVREASKTDLNVEWLKPFARPRVLKVGASVFVKGEAADPAFLKDLANRRRERINAFEIYRRQRDPGAVFCNDFVSQVLGH